MQQLNILSSKKVKVQSAKKIKTKATKLIDITVKDNHTFWISSKENHNYVLTHNSGMPDIDTDLSDRDKVLDELREFFGYNNVLPISNFNTLALKTVVRDLCRFFNIPLDEVNIALKTVEEDTRTGVLKEGDDKNLYQLNYDDAYVHCEPFRDFMDNHPELVKPISALYRANRALGRHAGGVLIGDDIPSTMPVITSKGEPQTPWVEGTNEKHLEAIGNFVKYDLLGLESLRFIERAIELIIDKDEIHTININGESHNIPAAHQVKLENGIFKLVGQLTIDDDITYPLEIKED